MYVAYDCSMFCRYMTAADQTNPGLLYRTLLSPGWIVSGANGPTESPIAVNIRPDILRYLIYVVN